jgi:sigma-B regulation protein RsbU (phosphoserine phosphatase)
MGSSITTRLIALLTLCAALIIGTGMLVDYRLSRDQILDRLQRESDETIQAVIIDMENWLEAVEGSTRLLARILEQRNYSHEGLQQMLLDVVANSKDIFGATIALAPGAADDPAGFAPYYFRRDHKLEFADLAAAGYDYQQQAWYTETVAAGEPQWIEPYLDTGGGDVLMTTFAVPVYRGNKEGERLLYAVVTADIALAELHEYLQRLHLGDSGFGILLSRSGIILSAANPANIMRHYSASVATAQDKSTWHGMFEAALAGQSAHRKIACDGLPGQCVFRLGALRSTGWPVGVVYSEDEMLAPMRAFQLKTAAIGCLTLLLMALAVVIVTRRITRPLSALALASDSIARGDLNTALPVALGEDEVARLIHSFTAMQRDLKSYLTDLEAATARRSRLEGELGAAREIQMAMLPHGGNASESESGWGLWARVRPARSVGGDLYDYQRQGNTLFIAVGDVSDKGVPAALFMARAMGLIQQLASAAPRPADAMASLNDALEEGNENCMFVTLFLGALDLDSGELRFASAGHTPPSLVRDGHAESIAQEQGPALGLVPGLVYEENRLRLLPGDRLAVFTDGIDEAFNAQDEMFGIARFNRALLETGTEPAAAAGPALFARLDDFAGETPQSDDITLLLLDLPLEEGRETRATSSRSSRSFATGAGLASSVHTWLEQALAPIADAAVQDLLLVAEEMVSNVDKYAGLPPGAALELTLEADSRQLVLELRDRGEAFDPLEQASRAELGADTASASIGGLGVHLITALTDRQSYHREEGWNILRVTKSLENNPGEV